jgi:hypothetical protein
MQIKMNVSPEMRDRVVKQLAIYSYAAKAKKASAKN